MSVETMWQNMYKKLVLFKHREEHCEVPRTNKAYPGLDMWVAMKRQKYILIKEGKVSTVS